MSGRWNFVEGEPRPFSALGHGLMTEARTIAVRKPHRPGELITDAEGRQIRVLPATDGHTTIDNVRTPYNTGLHVGDVTGQTGSVRRLRDSERH